MSRHTPDTGADDEQDALWDLLAQAPPRQASARFVNQTLRAARLLEVPTPWWKKGFRPIPLASLAAVSTAAIAIITSGIFTTTPHRTSPVATRTGTASSLQEIVETEALIAASENLDKFTDHELVCLIGF